MGINHHCFLMVGIICLAISRPVISRNNKEEIMQQIFYKKLYNADINPTNINDTNNIQYPTKVDVNVFIRNIEDINTENMEFKAQLTFRMKWVDSRLRYDDLSSDVEYIILNKKPAVWIPDIFFSNAREEKTFNLLQPNVYTRIYPDGTILYSTRLSLTLSCPMNLRRYPHDRQICPIRIASYGLTSADLLLAWKEQSPVQVNKNLYVPDFTLTEVGNFDCSSKTSTGEYSCLAISLSFRRSCVRHVRHVFIPYTLIVITSWIPFWMHRLISARLIINMLAVLLPAAYFMFNGYQLGQSYATALDVWACSCLLFTFLSMLETVIVMRFLKKRNDRQLKGQMHLWNLKSSQDSIQKNKSRNGSFSSVLDDCHILHPEQDTTDHVLLIDTVSQIIFPSLFVLFLFCYRTIFIG